MKILILKPSSLGDVVQALPVLRIMKRHYPASQIYWWLAEDLVPLLAGDADLAGIYRFDRRGWASPVYWKAIVDTVVQMRRQSFDLVIDLQSLSRSAVVAWLVKGAFTIGMDDSREGAPAFYDAAVKRPSRDTHAVDWYLKVLSYLGIPIRWDFEWLPCRPEAVERLRARWQPDAAPWIALHAGGRWLNKRWPIEYFRELVLQLSSSNPDLRFAVLGSRNESDLGRFIAQANPSRCLDLTGQTTLSEMIEWIRLSRLVITNDSGPMHAAAALGRPIVALFGPTDPRRTGPYGQSEQVLRIDLPCSPCLRKKCNYSKHLECLRAISPGIVAAEVKRRLAESGGIAPAGR